MALVGYEHQFRHWDRREQTHFHQKVRRVELLNDIFHRLPSELSVTLIASRSGGPGGGTKMSIRADDFDLPG